MMDDTAFYDLVGTSFEDFVSFLFEHPVDAPLTDQDQAGHHPWYWKVVVRFEPVRVAADYARLFADPQWLQLNYTQEQLEQGIWAIQSNSLPCSVAEIIWHEDVPFVMRENCVRAMYPLFARLFAHAPFEKADEMWWESLTYDWFDGRRDRKNGGDDLRMQDVMFETLQKILFLPAPVCQGAALHGLGHLRHPATGSLIRLYLDQYRDADRDLRAYAMAASRFDVD